MRSRIACCTLLILAAPTGAGDWPFWRGRAHTGVADGAPSVAAWSKDGQGLVWRRDFTGRSTPVVFAGRVCATGRDGEGTTRQETVACWDAKDGRLLWQRRFPVVHTAVPWNRVGWAAPAADPETGHLYVQNVDGLLLCFDSEGETVWRWELGPDLGRFSGYGGRTNTPLVDGDRLVVHVIGSAWGELAPGGDRWIAFDKRTGAVLWVSPKGGAPKDLNTYSTPVPAVVGGRRLVVAGGADGWIHALEATTGRAIWRFHLSQRGLNSSPVVQDGVVFATHSEENLDEGTMGRVVAIDATGSGDVTATHERWRANEVTAGYASPTLAGDRLYVVDNSANLLVYRTSDGRRLWEHSLGTVGKGSPVVAGGRVYATEVNGNVIILGLAEDGGKRLDDEHLEMPDGSRYAEIYASPAVAYGRVYFTTEEGIYCLGDPEASFPAEAGSGAGSPDEPAPSGATPVTLQIVPGVLIARAGDRIELEARLHDDLGRPVAPRAVAWRLEGLPGALEPGPGGTTGVVELANDIAGTRVGRVTARLGELSAVAHLRVAGPLPWREDFGGIEPGGEPAAWLGTGKGARVVAVDGERYLVQPKAARGSPRARILLGPSFLADYTVQADVRGTRQGRRRPDVGLVNGGYTLDLQGNHQRIQVRSWDSELRMAQLFPFAWEMDTWYTMKMRVEVESAGAAERKAVIRGKVWPRGQPEPETWTVTVEDPLALDHGSPGLYAFSPVEAHFDNVIVTANR